MKNSRINSPQEEPRQITKAAFDVVALAASAGGIKAISEVVSALPADFPASLVFVLHLDPKHRSMVADILGRRTELQVRQAEAGDRLRSGTLNIAPPNHHLLVNPDGTISLTQSELVNFVRPSADLLFDSAAESYKQRVLAVVLTGTGRDGITGIRAVKKRGGTVIVQDPETAEFPSMPQTAFRTGVADFVLPLAKIAPKIAELVVPESTK